MKILICLAITGFTFGSTAQTANITNNFEAAMKCADKLEAKDKKNGSTILGTEVYLKKCADLSAIASGNMKGGSEKCEKRVDAYQESRKEAMEKCGDYLGGGINECMSKMADCAPDTSADDSGDSISTILSALGMPSLKSTSAKCPQFTSEVLKERLDGIEDNIKTSKEKVTKLTETIQEEREKVMKAQAEVETTRIGAEHSVIEGQIGYMAEQREIAAASKTAEHRLERDVDRAHAQMLKAQGQMGLALQEKNRNLLNLKRHCDDTLEVERARVQAEINEYRASGQVLSGGIGSQVRIDKHYQNKLKRFYTRCVKRAQDDRKMIIDAANKQTKLARQEMRRAENEMNRTRDAINIERSRARAEVAEKETRSAALSQQKRKQTELAYSKLSQVQTQYTAVQGQINTQIQTEQQQIMMTTVQLSSLKAQQPKAEITATPNQVRSALGDMVEAAGLYINAEKCCPRNKAKSTSSKVVFADNADQSCTDIYKNVVYNFNETHDLDEAYTSNGER